MAINAVSGSGVGAQEYAARLSAIQQQVAMNPTFELEPQSQYILDKFMTEVDKLLKNKSSIDWLDMVYIVAKLFQQLVDSFSSEDLDDIIKATDSKMSHLGKGSFSKQGNSGLSMEIPDIMQRLSAQGELPIGDDVKYFILETLEDRKINDIKGRIQALLQNGIEDLEELSGIMVLLMSLGINVSASLLFEIEEAVKDFVAITIGSLSSPEEMKAFLEMVKNLSKGMVQGPIFDEEAIDVFFEMDDQDSLSSDEAFDEAPDVEGSRDRVVPSIGGPVPVHHIDEKKDSHRDIRSAPIHLQSRHSLDDRGRVSSEARKDASHRKVKRIESKHNVNREVTKHVRSTDSSVVTKDELSTMQGSLQRISSYLEKGSKEIEGRLIDASLDFVEGILVKQTDNLGGIMTG